MTWVFFFLIEIYTSSL